MSALYDITLNFNPSRDFKRCIRFAHILAGFLVVQTTLHLWIVVILWLSLLISYYKNHHSEYPHPVYKSLTLSGKEQWILIHHSGYKEQFNKINIQFEGGFFSLVRLTHETNKRTFVLFHDQIEKNHLQQLRILSRIT